MPKVVQVSSSESLQPHDIAFLLTFITATSQFYANQNSSNRLYEETAFLVH